MTEAPQKLLVVGPAWVGDMVMSQVLYSFLAQSCPDIVIDVVAPPWSAALLQRMPEVRRAIALPLAHGELGLGQRRRLGLSLSREGYNQAIVLPNSFKSALVPWFARIPRRTGWRGEMRYGLLNDLRILDTEALPSMAQRFLALGLDAAAKLPRAFPRPSLAVDRRAALELAAGFGLDTATPMLALCPGAEFGGAKRWPAEHFASVARQYLDCGWQVVLYGSGKESEQCAAIAALAGGTPACHNLAGETALLQAIDLLSLADAVVANDSGLMHMAAALDRPVLAIYGPTSPDFAPPLNDRACSLHSGEDCSPCFQRECPLGHHACMRNLSAQTVGTRLQGMIGAQGSDP